MMPPRCEAKWPGTAKWACELPAGHVEAGDISHRHSAGRARVSWLDDSPAARSEAERRVGNVLFDGIPLREIV